MPIYRFRRTDQEIAFELSIAETVEDYISCLMHFLKFHTRAKLVFYASSAQRATWGIYAA
jgi:DNA-binding NarL/FixJ family response regulator